MSDNAPIKTRCDFAETAQALLRQGSSVRLRATGNSMQPTICDGEIIEIRPLNARRLKPGEIILFAGRNGARAHRIRKIHRDATGEIHITTRGDASDEDDAGILRQDVLGFVAVLEREGKRVNLNSLAERTAFNLRSRMLRVGKVRTARKFLRAKLR